MRTGPVVGNFCDGDTDVFNFNGIFSYLLFTECYCYLVVACEMAWLRGVERSAGGFLNLMSV